MKGVMLSARFAETLDDALRQVPQPKLCRAALSFTHGHSFEASSAVVRMQTMERSQSSENSDSLTKNTRSHKKRKPYRRVMFLRDIFSYTISPTHNGEFRLR